MKKIEISDLRTKSSQELTKLAEKTRLEIAKIKTDMSASREKNLKKVKNLRHNLAQTLSLLREKQIAEEVEQEGGKVK